MIPTNILRLLVASGFLLVAPTVLLAQSESEEDETPLDIKIETPEFQKATDDLQAHLEKMNEVIVRYSVGDDIEDNKWRRRWLELCQEGNRLHQAMVEAALDEYLIDPEGKSEIGEMLFRILRRNCKADRFEGMLPVAKALVDTNYPRPLLLNYAAQSAFAANEYNAARPYFEALVDRQQDTALIRETIESLDQYTRMWEEELRQRQEDEAGEPLPRVLIRTTKGDMEVELFENQAPNTVANFISLVEQGFYESRDFHRVVEHFMAQTGCPNDDGTGGPGYKIASEADEPNARNFFRGTLGLALAQNSETVMPDPFSGGSQFFITFLPLQELNGNYTAFGRVIDGIEVLPNLVKIDPIAKEEKSEDEPEKIPDEVIEIEILYKRDHQYEPKKLQF